MNELLSVTRSIVEDITISTQLNKMTPWQEKRMKEIGTKGWINGNSNVWYDLWLEISKTLNIRTISSNIVFDILYNQMICGLIIAPLKLSSINFHKRLDPMFTRNLMKPLFDGYRKKVVTFLCLFYLQAIYPLCLATGWSNVRSWQYCNPFSCRIGTSYSWAHIESGNCVCNPA